jgi:hypothetical protein
MIVTRQGGTGKSVLIDAITETFSHKGRQATLAKCTPSGIAAIHIGGCTIHHWTGLGVQRPKNIGNCSKTIATH